MQRFFLPLILLIVLLVYSPTFSVYFSHDDFFHFKASQTDGTFAGFINLFGFHPFAERGYGFYRPIFREGLFNVFYSLFGLNPLPFRILSLLIHGINIYLVYVLTQKLLNKRTLAMFVALFFGLSAANVGSLYYLAGGVQSLGVTMFILLSVILFLNSRTLFSFIAFIFALGSHELAVMVPFVLLGISIAKKRSLVYLWPFFLASLIFTYLDFSVAGFSSNEQQYKTAFSPKTILNSLAWYISWAFGFPEMFLDFIGPKFSVNPNLIRFWGEYAAGIFFFGSTALSIFLGCVILVFRELFKKKEFWLLVIWFPLAILPVIILPLHKSTYYLNPALAPFWGLIGLVVFTAYDEFIDRRPILTGFLSGFFLASIFSLSVTSIFLADKTYPAVNRGRIAQKLIVQTLEKYPILPRGAVIYFKNDQSYPKISGSWGGSSKQAEFALNGSDALQLIYNDPTLNVFYEDSVSEPPPGAHTLVAKISN